ncbi:MAG: AAA family ATPase, partial [Owenweeksia sp.]
MAKSKTTFFCQNCGAQHSKWMGQCNKCNAWNTIVEEVVSTTATKTPWQNTSSSSPVKAAKAHRINTLQTDETQRFSTTDNELDRVLGGGVVPGSVTLVGGEPGIGKSTLMLQVALQLSMKCLYVSGEESEQQVKLRAERIGISNEDCYLLTATRTQEIFQQIALTEPDIVILDS